VVPQDLRDCVDGPSLLIETLARRGFVDADSALAFLDPDQYHPAPAEDLPDLTRAAERVERAVERGEVICVWGDFDVDGQTSTTVLVATLRDLGADVIYHIPVRKKESHGVNVPWLDRVIDAGAELILTCDTGSSAHQAISRANQRGVDVVVTDHHDLPPSLPAAYAIVNPKMLPGSHPLRELPGVGCAYKLAEALYRRAGRAGEEEQYLDLVALGIVADVAVQTGDTRYLLQRGLRALRRTPRVGLRVLMENAHLNLDWVTEEHIGYVIAPRMNSLGRLSDAGSAVEFLTTTDRGQARILADELEGLNTRRRMLVRQVLEAVEDRLRQEPALLQAAAIVVSSTTWPGGILGIVAGRLASRYGRPVVLISTADSELGHGSARSVEGCNIAAAFDAHTDMLVQHGGHPMAAGLAIEPERIPEFRDALSHTVREMMGAAPREATIEIDGYVSLQDVSLGLVEQLERLAPFGFGNPPLTLACRNLAVVSDAAIGVSGEHRRVTVEDVAGHPQTVLWWGGGDADLPSGRFDLALVLRASNYRGQRSVQVEWVDARPLEPQDSLPRAVQRPLAVVDYRKSANYLAQLQPLLDERDLQVWSEGPRDRAITGLRDGLTGSRRDELRPGSRLAIWTAPPGPGVLRQALKRVRPEAVYLFAASAHLDSVEPFLTLLAGLAKYVCSKQQGDVLVVELAGATSQREATVRAGLDWLAARADLVVSDKGEGALHLELGDPDAATDSQPSTDRLNELLQETAAYRSYFRQAPEDALLKWE